MKEVRVNGRAKHTTTLKSQFDVIHGYIEHVLLSAIHDHFERRLSAVELMRRVRSGRSGSTAPAFSEKLQGKLSENAQLQMQIIPVQKTCCNAKTQIHLGQFLLS
jgi:hypothetical protein